MLKITEEVEIDKVSIFRSPNPTGKLNCGFSRILGFLEFVLHSINKPLSLEAGGSRLETKDEIFTPALLVLVA